MHGTALAPPAAAVGEDAPHHEPASPECVVATQIETYLAKHPGAADTLAGICHWWLSGAPEVTVQRALDDLVARGTVKRLEVPGGAAVYSRGTAGGFEPPNTKDP